MRRYQLLLFLVLIYLVLIITLLSTNYYSTLMMRRCGSCLQEISDAAPAILGASPGTRKQEREQTY